ncbi:ADP-ribose glycohydrolase MACROD2 isoform X1 [Lepisosteus oculatus]|uniref:ADP-ribose glycohydrolase MACROD2 isoform X1 n=1 Tax=Lepisosteus oculatus TaxID=7918 RepID=UPI0035F52482
MSKKKKDWKVEKERLQSLGLEERRKEYRGNYVPLEKIPTWKKSKQEKSKYKEEVSEVSAFHLSDKVSLYKGDITTLEVDAIVNAANSSLLGGGGVDGCIHRAAGPCLFDECQTLNGCDTGQAKITSGYDLPAKYVIHTVGPVARGHVGKTQRELLANCYENSLMLLKENGLRSVAFPCISTGIYGFPNEPAADIALETVKNWIKKNNDEIDRVIFCIFLETDFRIYKEKMSDFFSEENNINEDAAEEPTKEEGKKYTPPVKKPKKKKSSRGEDSNEEEEDEKDEPADAEMESLKDEDNKPDNTDAADAEMESQKLEAENTVNLEEQKEENEEEDKVSARDKNTEEDKLSLEHSQGDESMEDPEITEVQSENSSNQDEGKSQSAEVGTEAPESHEQTADPTGVAKETCISGEPMDGTGSASNGTSPSKQETNDINEAEMNTQVEDSQEFESTPTENSQSKDYVGKLKDP